MVQGRGKTRTHQFRVRYADALIMSLSREVPTSRKRHPVADKTTGREGAEAYETRKNWHPGRTSTLRKAMRLRRIENGESQAKLGVMTKRERYDVERIRRLTTQAVADTKTTTGASMKALFEAMIGKRAVQNNAASILRGGRDTARQQP